MGFRCLLILMFVAAHITVSSAQTQTQAQTNLASINSPQQNQDISAQSSQIKQVTNQSLATAFALVPGVFFAGSGQLYLGERQLATKLFWWKLSGLIGLIGGGALLAKSGASALVTPWATPLLIGSGGSFLLPNLLELASIWAPHEKVIAQSPPQIGFNFRRSAPLIDGLAQRHLSFSLGTRQTVTESYHPLYALAWSDQHKEIAYQIMMSMADSQSRYVLNTEYPLKQTQAWALWTRVGFSSHLYQEKEIGLHQAEFSFRLKLNFAQLLGSRVRHLSAEMFTGWSGGALSYAQGAVDELSGILGGFKLTHHSFNDRARVQLGYNHRHDDWVGGAILPGLGSGVLGYAEAALAYKVSKWLWLKFQGRFGSAHVYTLQMSFLDAERTESK